VDDVHRILEPALHFFNRLLDGFANPSGLYDVAFRDCGLGFLLNFDQYDLAASSLVFDVMTVWLYSPPLTDPSL
jgi:hypothetical protein